MRTNKAIGGQKNILEVTESQGTVTMTMEAYNELFKKAQVLEGLIELKSVDYYDGKYIQAVLNVQPLHGIVKELFNGSEFTDTHKLYTAKQMNTEIDWYVAQRIEEQE